MRKNYIDNIRILCILLLFPFHTCMIFNNWGELFYITSKPYSLPSNFVSLVYPWWMNLMFTIAGISTYYALQKRTTKEYAKERFQKLFLPLLVGIVVIIPVQSYIANVYHHNYAGGYFRHYQVFFSKFTNLTGQDGGFTPGHLWFMLYLYIISMVMLINMKGFLIKKSQYDGSKVKIVHLVPMFLLILLCTPILELGGKSIGESFICFVLGFFLLSYEKVQETLERNYKLLLLLFLSAILGRLIMQFYDVEGLLFDIEQRVLSWFGILAILGFGKRFLNHSNSLTTYFSKAAFSLYYFHQSILVVLGFFVLKQVDNVRIQFLLIMVGSFILSLLFYEIFRRNKVTSILFGIKYKSPRINN